MASLKSLFEIRTKNWAQAMYESEKKIDVLQALQEEIDDPNKKLYIPSTETIKNKIFLNIFSHGKMANLTKWSFRSIFGFDTINTEGSSNYDLTFSKINGEGKVVE